MMMATRGSGPTRLRLYHEVAVADPAEQWFEYVGCRGRTGLLDISAHGG
jgi:aldoxime dehydratase